MDREKAAVITGAEPALVPLDATQASRCRGGGHHELPWPPIERIPEPPPFWDPIPVPVILPLA